MGQSEDFCKEAEIFGKYFLKEFPDRISVSLYQKLMVMNPPLLNLKEKRMLKFMLRHPWSVAFFDAGLALTNPKSAVRQKIFSMLAILESSKNYHALFLSRDFSKFYPVFIFFILSRAVVKAVIGSILILFI